MTEPLLSRELFEWLAKFRIVPEHGVEHVRIDISGRDPIVRVMVWQHAVSREIIEGEPPPELLNATVKVISDEEPVDE